MFSHLFVSLLLTVFWPTTPATRQTQTTDAGKTLFTDRCAVCHGLNAAGGTFATSILPRIAALDDATLTATIRNGVPASGMVRSFLRPH